jgi:hypothetical protein
MEEPARILGISVNATKGRVLMDERNCERYRNTVSDHLGLPEGTFHKRFVTRGTSRKIKPSAMRVVKGETREALMDLLLLLVTVLAALTFLCLAGQAVSATRGIVTKLIARKRVSAYPLWRFR